MRIHFIAIGGSVMHQLAIALKLKGNDITGSDDEIFEPAKSNLQKEGIASTHTGWFPEKITKDIEAVILGMHAKEDNPELQRAREIGLPIFSFPEYIYKESADKTRVAVGGSHGKTSTTAMIMHVLKSAGLDFDYMVGARLDGFSQSVNITSAPIMVCEADEYPASTIERRPKFHFLFPHIAIITGIAWDHINVFPTFDFYVEQFAIFIEKIQPGGLLIYNVTDDVLRLLVEGHTRSDINYQPYGLPAYAITDGKTKVQLEGGTAALKIFGNHNLLNLHAAYFACKELGVATGAFLEAIKEFKSAAKRLELISVGPSVNIYRDFAHAPSKVRASIEAVKQQFPARVLVAILELHTYSSLNGDFMQQYRGAMDQADVAIVFYSEHALQLKRMPPLEKEVVQDGFEKNGLLVFTHKEELQDWLQHYTFANTSVLLMSSGDYDGVDIAGYIKNEFEESRF